MGFSIFEQDLFKKVNPQPGALPKFRTNLGYYCLGVPYFDKALSCDFTLHWKTNSCVCSAIRGQFTQHIFPLLFVGAFQKMECPLWWMFQRKWNGRSSGCSFHFFEMPHIFLMLSNDTHWVSQENTKVFTLDEALSYQLYWNQAHMK